MIFFVILFVGFLIFMLSTQGLNNGSGTLIAILLFVIIPMIINKGIRK